MVFWDEVFAGWRPTTRTCEPSSPLVDAGRMDFVAEPDSFDVVVASNLFGDILTRPHGGASPAASAWRRAPTSTPRGRTPACSSRSTARRRTSPGKGIANPLAAILSAALMLEFLGEERAARGLERAVELVTADPATRTVDLGGTAGTAEAGAAVRERLAETLVEA